MYVTHDQLEAMAMADTIALMNHGVVEQLGTPQDIYDRPVSLFVADFIGSPPMSFLSFRGHVTPGDRTVRVNSVDIALPEVREGRADAVVSAGNTGAMLAASLLEIRRIAGVRRPAIAVTIPARRGPSVLLDSGANADARPEDLLQFAHMGAVFSAELLGVERPEVRLLSIGEEDEKGNQLTLEAHALLAASDLRFGGNVESRELLAGAADVVVTDGFTGNVCL